MNSASPALSPLPLHSPSLPRKRPNLVQGAPIPGARVGLGQASALQRVGVAGLVIIVHLVGLALLARFATRPVVIPELTTISLALIQAEPAVAPVAPAPAPVAPAPAPVAPQPPTPPKLKEEKVEPPPEPPPKPQPRPEPSTKPKPTPPPPTPTPTPRPKLTQSASALSQPESAPEPSAAPAPAAPAPPASPAAPAVTAAPAAAAAALTAARFDAAYLNNPSPAYPMLSRRLREEGEVMLRVLVAADGQAKRIEVRTGSGSNRLDRAAEDAVARWRFVPARRGDSAVEAWVLVPIVFKLKGN